MIFATPAGSRVLRLMTSPPMRSFIAAGQSSPVQNRQASAAVSFVHQMSGHQYCHAFVFLDLGQKSPEIDPRRGIEPRARLVEEENLRPMQKSLGDLHAPP